MQFLAPLRVNALEHIENMASQRIRDAINQAATGVRQLQADGPPITEIPLAGDVARTLEAVEDAGDGLRLLREVVRNEVRLGTVEGLNGKQRHGLNERDVVLATEALIEFAHGGVGCSVEARNEGEIARVIR